ncbi:IS110 family transposase [Flavobacterium sp. GSP27]|jgi:transposase|uniref:IS110 family transposase n=1 Tax=Flavobacterium sp. GSP27 TaxID=2497489 RepID=UPI000F841D5F|nr:IS110 family transposase [Flavobacterium sp. GSP27]RTZ10620.1 IS110 family transposase [Flavobacterium sp. GSP27]
MNKFTHFLGIDISKEYFDAVIILEGKKELNNHNQFANNAKGIRELRKWLKEFNATSVNTLVCLEHTGMYGKLVIKHLISYEFSLWVEMSLKIIRSIGLQRGKNDKVDAFRIAYYAMKNQEEAVIYKAPRKVVEKIKTLLSVRDKLIQYRGSLSRHTNELKSFDPELYKLAVKHQNNTIKGIATDLKSIEKQLDLLIKEDEILNTIYTQVSSVPGVGKITTLTLICFTNEFSMYATPRQLACYTGVAPFEYTSGKSIKGKPRVNNMANKKLKKLLHMCALTAATYDPELKVYYQRKVEESKNKLLVLNNVRNKLIHRICACIKENRVYKIREVA